MIAFLIVYLEDIFIQQKQVTFNLTNFQIFDIIYIENKKGEISNVAVYIFLYKNL
jgi:hypothetical protein